MTNLGGYNLSKKGGAGSPSATLSEYSEQKKISARKLASYLRYDDSIKSVFTYKKKTYYSICDLDKWMIANQDKVDLMAI